MLGLVLLGVLCGCSGESASRRHVVRGTVTYAEGGSPPPRASLVVRLARLAGDSLSIVAEETISDLGRPPHRFAVPYDPRGIDTTARYVMEARVLAPDGGLLMENRASFPVLTHGYADSVAIRVQPERRSTRAPAVLEPGNLALGLAAAQAEDLEVRRRIMQTREGELTAAGGTSRFSAYFEANELCIVEERFDAGDRRERRARYYFKEGRLFFYRTDDPGGETTDGVRLAFDPEGILEAGARVENGRAGDPDPQDVAAVRERLVVLQAAAAGLHP